MGTTCCRYRNYGIDQMRVWVIYIFYLINFHPRSRYFRRRITVVIDTASLHWFRVINETHLSNTSSLLSVTISLGSSTEHLQTRFNVVMCLSNKMPLWTSNSFPLNNTSEQARISKCFLIHIVMDVQGQEHCVVSTVIKDNLSRLKWNVRTPVTPRRCIQGE